MHDDLRHALRTLARARLATAVVVLVLGVGIGALTTLFGFVYSFSLRAMPYPEPERLVSLAEERGGDRSFQEMRPATAEAITAHARSFSDVVAFRERSANLAVGGVVEPAPTGEVTPNVFRMLRATPVLGRALGAVDAPAGAEPVVVLSHRLWERRFGARGDVIGRSVLVGGTPHTVVGVMPPAFSFHTSAQLWRPLRLAAVPAEEYVHVIARLRDGVAPAVARAEVEGLAASLAAAAPAGYGDVALRVREELFQRGGGGLPRPVAILLLLAAGGVLVVACVNVANLLLARNVARRREMAVRAAVGASRGRLLRLALSESAVLVTAATALGFVLSLWGTWLVTGVVGESAPAWLRFGIDGRVFVFTAATAALTVLAFGLPVALDASRARLQGVLAGGGSTGATPRRSRGMRALVAVQMALAVTMVTGTLLLLRSYERMRQVDPGVDAAQVLTFSLSLDEARYATPRARAAFHDALAERLAGGGERPGVAWEGDFAGWWRPRPGGADSLALPDSGWRLHTDAAPERGRWVPHSRIAVVAPSYFATVGLPLRDGRLFGAEDRAGAPAAALVSEAMAQALWPGERAVGRRVRLGVGNGVPWATVVGVAGDTRGIYQDIRRGMREVAQPVLYLAGTQAGTRTPTLLLRAAGDPLAQAPRVRAVVAALDAAQAATRFRTLADVQTESQLAVQRWMSSVLGALGAITLGLAVVGLYGVITYNVAQRIPEIGVRMALGARAGDVARMVAGQTLRLALAGVGAGLLLALGAGRLLRLFLLEVSPADPVALGGVALLFVAIAAGVAFAPARRAARADPASALRAE